MGILAVKRYRFLFIALAAGLIALLTASCGGNASATTLAVVFRLDGGSPALSAYAGDLDENPLELPPGHYYIEAVSEDDVLITLGEMDIEPGQVIALVPFQDNTGGSLADPERAQALKTIANFLIDVELARFAVLESASNGFTTPLFDPAAEPDGADLEQLFAMYGEIAAQEDPLRSSLLTIARGAEVSMPVSYVYSGAAPSRGIFDRLLNSALPDFFNRISTMPDRERNRVLDITDKIDPREQQEIFDRMPPNLRGDAAGFRDWISDVQRGEHDDELGAIHGYLYAAAAAATQEAGHTPGAAVVAEGGPLIRAGVDLAVDAYGRVPHVGKAIDVTNKARQWEQYIRGIYVDPAGGAETLLRDEYQKLLEDRIKSDLRQMAPHLSDSIIDSLAGQLSNRVVSAVPQLTGTAVPAASPTPDTGWIDELVQYVTDDLLAQGESGIDIAVAADDLRQCLMGAVQDGLTRDEALSYCADLLAASDTPTPTPTPDTGWIDDLIQDITDRLLAQGQNGIDIAVFTDDLRLCLVEALQDGLDSEQALSYCADTLMGGETPTPREPTPPPTREPCNLEDYDSYYLDESGVHHSDLEDLLDCLNR